MGETIDLSLHGEPTVATSFVNPAAAQAKLAGLDDLPTGTDQEGERDELFASMDPNSNGFLSLAEVDAGLRARVPGLASKKQALLRAFQASKGARRGTRALSDDMVEKGEEFRLLLLYLHRYLELLCAFEQLDTDGDRRLDAEEFEAACAGGVLAKWGVHVHDPRREFEAIDLNGGGVVRKRGSKPSPLPCPCLVPLLTARVFSTPV